MALDDELAEVFDRGLRDGIASLNPTDKQLFLIQYFICELEMNGLTGYFYNQLPALAHTHETIAAMRVHGINQLADLLAEAASLFNGYCDPSPPTTWSAVLSKYDPSDSLSSITSRMHELPGYGFPESHEA